MQCRFSKLRSISFNLGGTAYLEDQNLMDAVGVLCESEHEKGPHMSFVNPSVDNMLSTLLP
jgi:hypothetical protein